MPTPDTTPDPHDEAWYTLANQLFFRLYQCANLLHKTGTRAVEHEGLTTQRWAVLGALSHPDYSDGLAVGDLARHLRVTRQSLFGLTNYLEHEGLITSAPDPADRRSRLLRLTSAGVEKWQHRAIPAIHEFYASAADGLSADTMRLAISHLSHLVDNMVDLDTEQAVNRPDPTET